MPNHASSAASSPNLRHHYPTSRPARCSDLIYAPHTTEGFSQQIASLFIGIALALQCDKTLVLTPSLFSLTYEYVSWGGMSEATRLELHDKGTTLFIDLSHMIGLLDGRKLHTATFDEARNCLPELPVCHYILPAYPIAPPPSSMHNLLGDNQLWQHWMWFTPMALLWYNFSADCETLAYQARQGRRYARWEDGFAVKMHACFSGMPRVVRWAPLSVATTEGVVEKRDYVREVNSTDSRTCRSGPVDAPLCFAGGSWLVQQALLPSGQALVQRLTAHYRHSPRYMEAARRYITQALVGTNSSPHSSLIVIHWRRGDFLADHPDQQEWTLPRTIAAAQRYLRNRTSDRGHGEEHGEAHAHGGGLADATPPAVYVMWGGSSPEDDPPFDHSDVIMLPRADARQLLGNHYVGDIDLVLLEQEIALQSTVFVGNEASGISKWILARRCRVAISFPREISTPRRCAAGHATLVVAADGVIQPAER